MEPWLKRFDSKTPDLLIVGKRRFQATRRCGGIGPRQEIVDVAVWMVVDDLGDDVCKVGRSLSASLIVASS